MRKETGWEVKKRDPAMVELELGLIVMVTPFPVKCAISIASHFLEDLVSVNK
jgi:hypothetical protein